MGNSVLVFISHSSEDKKALIEPLVRDLEACYINVWLDKRKIVPGDNLRKSIFRDGLDKADIALIFFTENSLKSSWVDREIKHVLREEKSKGNDFDLNKIISIFDSDETYNTILDRYSELTDHLLHLMPIDYSSIQLGQLVSAIWSKHLSLQGGDVATQKKLLEKDRELFRKEQEIAELRQKIEKLNSNTAGAEDTEQFQKIFDSGVLEEFIGVKDMILEEPVFDYTKIPNLPAARVLGFIDTHPMNIRSVVITEKGKAFFKWLLLEG